MAGLTSEIAMSSDGVTSSLRPSEESDQPRRQVTPPGFSSEVTQESGRAFQTLGAGEPWQLIDATGDEFSQVADFVRNHRNPFVAIYPRWCSRKNVNIGSVTVTRVRKFMPNINCEPHLLFENHLNAVRQARGLVSRPGTKWLFHGTPRPAADIAADRQGGLDFRFAAMNLMSRLFDKFYGHGFYMADDLDYSHQFTLKLSGEEVSGTASVFICEAFTGRCMNYGSQKKRGLVRPPVRYDSVCGDIPGGSKMYVVYETSHLQPLYEVQYQFRAHSSRFRKVSPRFHNITGLSIEMLRPLFCQNDVCEAIATSKLCSKSEVKALLAVALSSAIREHQQRSHDDSLARDVLLMALEHSGVALEDATLQFKMDEELVRAAVRHDGLALKHASPELQHNRDIVLTAVTQFGMALQYAAEELKGDYHVVLAAVQNYACALEYASQNLKDDPRIVAAALSHTGESEIRCIVKDDVLVEAVATLAKHIFFRKH